MPQIEIAVKITPIRTRLCKTGYIYFFDFDIKSFQKLEKIINICCYHFRSNFLLSFIFFYQIFMYGNKLTEKPNFASKVLPPSIKNFKIGITGKTGFGRLALSVQFNKSTKN